MTVQPDAISQSVEADIRRIFALQQKYQWTVAASTPKERRAKLQKLHDAVLRYRTALQEAMWNDFRKPAAEVDLSELYTITSEIKHVRKNLRRWMYPQRVSNPITMLGTRSYIHYEPKGVVLIIAPWNYPINLTLGPIITAIAAGNCAIVKPSEHTPHTSALLQKLVGEVFEEQEIALVQGAIECSQALLRLPFNHVFFTGAPAIGKIVMAAAARHLSSVTLELGGKSPCIIDQSASIQKAAARICWSKFLNSSQTCIAPDYIWIHESKKEAFVKALKEEVQKFYGADSKSSKDYARMVNQRHFERVKGYYEDAVQGGAQTLFGGEFDAAERYIAPTLMTSVEPQSDLMQNEIFGPILPLYTFNDLEEPLKMINAGEKPLALYVFSKRQQMINRTINETRAGTSCVNHAAIQYGHHNLPFGGVNNSGIGKTHGEYAFREFSNARAILHQRWPISSADFFTAPYTQFKQKLIDLAIKWF